MNSKNLKIDNDNSERRLDNYLFSIYKSLPKSKIYSMIRKGEVRVNSKRIKPSYKLKSEDEIRIPPYLINYREHLKQVKIPQKRIDIYKKSVLFLAFGLILATIRRLRIANKMQPPPLFGKCT